VGELAATKSQEGHEKLAHALQRAGQQIKNVSQNWPFPLVDYWSATLKPDPADFELRRAR
jgi:hypothetical protein